jgi:hypothetical protein
MTERTMITEAFRLRLLFPGPTAPTPAQVERRLADVAADYGASKVTVGIMTYAHGRYSLPVTAYTTVGYAEEA